MAVALGAGDGVEVLDESRLRGLELSAAGKVAVAVMLEDLRLLQECRREPVLNCVRGYPRDFDAEVVRTDVFSFHADRAPVEAETWLCTYFGAPSEGLRNEEARRRVDVPETRAALLVEFGGEDGEEFREYLAECSYDLHYEAVADGQAFSFGMGNLWKIAVEWPGCAVPSCIHRAPESEGARLMVIC